MTDANPDTSDTPVTVVPAVEKILERDTTVNGTPPEDGEDVDAPALAEGGNDVPPPSKGSPQG